MKYVIDKQESQRLNIIKFIAVIMVVFIHSYNLRADFGGGVFSKILYICENVISEGFARMAVPTLFLISAILLFQKEQKYFLLLKKKFKRLFIPFFIWNSFSILIYFVFQSIDSTRQFFAVQNYIISDFGIRNWIKAYGVSLTEGPYLYPLWFMRDLLVMMVLYPVLKFVITKMPKISLVAGLLLFFMPETIPFQVALSMFLIGGCIVKFNVRMADVDKISTLKLSIIYIVALCLKLNFSNFLFDGINIIVGIMFWVKFSKIVLDSTKLNSVFTKISPYAFIIYLGHEPLLSRLKKILIYYIPDSSFNLFAMYFGLSALVIGVWMIIGIVLKKYANRFYSFITGESARKQ